MLNLDGLLGMTEMEVAVKVIAERADTERRSFVEMVPYPRWFKTDTSQTGFVELVARGWLTRVAEEVAHPGYPNVSIHRGGFFISKKLSKRFNQHLDYKAYKEKS